MSSFAQFYCCYLLQSVSKKQSFYIGSSPNPYRRLRQHNGDLVAGGAYRTKVLGKRPWEMIMVVYGFPNKIVALQFEHAWQHAYSTHYIADEDRIVKNKNSGRSLHHKLGIVRSLLRHEFFRFMDLKVHFFNGDVYDVWEVNRFDIALSETEHNVTIEVTEGALKHIKAPMSVDEMLDYAKGNEALVEKLYSSILNEDRQRIDRYSAHLTEGALDCPVCHDTVDYASEDIKLKPHLAFCINDDCNFVCHLKCLCQMFLQKEEDDTGNEHNFIPLKGTCPDCKASIKWPKIVKYSSMVKSLHG